MSLTKVTYSMIDGAPANVLDFGADSNGVADCLAAFNAAAATGQAVYIPKGDFLISADTNIAFWYLDEGAYISGLPDVNGINNVSRLKGRIFYIENQGNTGIRVGDSGMWVENQYAFTQSISEMSVLSGNGTPALITGTRTSDDGTPSNEGAYALGAFGINDYTAGRQPCWGIYTNVTRYAGSGVVHNEFDMENFDAPGEISPLSQGLGMATNLWVSNGHGNASAYSGSAFLASQPNPKGWQRGIVIRKGSLDETENPFGIKEAMCVPVDAEITWYQDETSVVDVIYARYTADRVENTTFRNGVYPRYITNARPASGGTLSGAQIFGGQYYAYDGTIAVLGVNNTILAKTNVTGGNGRFAWQVEAMNSGGGYTGVAINIDGNARFTPMTDNAVTLGSTSYRWQNNYSTNFRPGDGAPIWTSGSGSPEGVVTASVGSLYTRTDGGANTTLYVKESGTGNTGWVGK